MFQDFTLNRTPSAKPETRSCVGVGWVTCMQVLRALEWQSRVFFVGKRRQGSNTVDDINPAFPLRTLNYGNYGTFLIVINP